MAESALHALADRLRAGPRITMLTGAGVSAASGVPTFRGQGGFWGKHKAEDLATPEAFARDPEKVWEWYAWRRGIVGACTPNRAHEVIAAWSHRYPGFTLVTQNVDGLHEKAGTEGLVRFHGSLWEMQCWNHCPGAPDRWWDAADPLPEVPPRCPHCAGMLRPGVVWFGEAIDPAVLDASIRACRCDLFLTVGTSALVHPAAGLILQARQNGAFTVEINPEATPATEAVDLVLAGPAEEILDQVERLLEREHPA